MDKITNNIIFCQARIPHGNQGDLVLTKVLLLQLRKHGKLIVNDLEVPEWYCQQLDLRDEERSSFYHKNFALMIWLYGLKALFQPNLKVYLILRPGHFYGNSTKLGNKMLLGALYYHLMRLIKVRICRFGTSIESLSKRLEIAEKLRASAMYFYSVRDSISKNYALKIGISQVHFFPDMAWFLQKRYSNDDLKWLMQVPNANKKSLHFDSPYVIFSFRNKYKEFDSSDYQSNLLEVLDEIVKLICNDWGYQIVICYQVDSDYKFSKTLMNRYQDDYNMNFIEDYIDSYSMYDLYGQASMVFSNRLHTLMFAMFCGALSIPIINKIKEQKINGIFSDAGLEEVILDVSQGSEIINNLPDLVAKSKCLKEKISLCFAQQQKVGEKIITQVFR
ncbi:MAG: polysaccharide pyruvyl transferase family protein [Microcoleaceae cyanobacterium MO_207.B10]|nr:polysaccharide pyruvyl transferase family protein [Microcoleaceae cyanobacterium MO_207.B10]